MSIDVEAIALDDWLEVENVTPSFIKIDAESAEHCVLEGLRRPLERHHRGAVVFHRVLQ